MRSPTTLGSAMTRVMPTARSARGSRWINSRLTVSAGRETLTSVAKRYSTTHTIVIATVSQSCYCPHRHNDGQSRSIVAAFRLLSGGVQPHACLDSPEISSARCRGRLSGSSAAAPSDRTANVARERGPRARLDLAQHPQLVLTLVQPTGSTPIRFQACSSSPRAPPISSRAASATTNTTSRRAC